MCQRNVKYEVLTFVIHTTSTVRQRKLILQYLNYGKVVNLAISLLQKQDPLFAGHW